MPFLAALGPVLAGIGGGSALAGGLTLGSTVAGPILGAIGKGGKQGGQTSSRTTTTDQNITDRVTQEELPEIGAFRNTLFPAFGQALADAQGPLFSENAQAAFLNRINDTSGAALDAISSNLARRGALNSGALGSAFTDVELSRNRDITDFLTKLPILERETRFNQTLPLLQLGMGFAGTGPQTVTSNRTGTTSATEEGDLSVQGPGFLRSLAGEGSDLLSLLLSGALRGGNNLRNPALANIPGVTSPPQIDAAYPGIDPIMQSIIFGDGSVPLPLGVS